VSKIKLALAFIDDDVGGDVDVDVIVIDIVCLQVETI